MKQGQPIAGLDWGGGFGFPGPWGFVASANITPDPSGIPFYDEALFQEVMHTGSVKARKLSPIMPVMVYRNLTDDDLKAMFAFLRTVKPVKHRVDNSAPPTLQGLRAETWGWGGELRKAVELRSTGQTRASAPTWGRLVYLLAKPPAVSAPSQVKTWPVM
jgi:hypothetical protein